MYRGVVCVVTSHHNDSSVSTVWRTIAYLYSLIINKIKYSLIKSYIQLEGSYMTRHQKENIVLDYLCVNWPCNYFIP
jgi:hypothetical protein